jgi:lipopolysaccharide biosynthesis protein
MDRQVQNDAMSQGWYSFTQIREIPEDLLNYFFATKRYDRTRLDQIRMFDGKLPKSDRTAIFLIFPKTGLLQSHVHTLAYFRSKGYATLIVSKLPLSEIDRNLLAENCWRIMERPNFGYDFGGYRDGVLSLSDDLPHLERLVLINDSVWFPLTGGRDWLDDVEALEVGFADAASHYGTPRYGINDFRSLKWSFSTNHRDFHICSFSICLRPTVMREANFLKFWRALRLSDKKKRTVRRGEIGFTQRALYN